MSGNPTHPIKIGKMEAALRQLRTAIRLWFFDGDPIAIHTLASAAHEIIHTLFCRGGLSGLLFDTDLIKDENRSDWAKSIKKYPTFFKHAQKDPDAEIEFNPELNEWLLFILVNALRKMDQKEGLEEMAFSRWIMVRHPEVVKEVYRALIPAELREQILQTNKADYFNGFEKFWSINQ